MGILEAIKYREPPAQMMIPTIVPLIFLGNVTVWYTVLTYVGIILKQKRDSFREWYASYSHPICLSIFFPHLRLPKKNLNFTTMVPNLRISFVIFLHRSSRNSKGYYTLLYSFKFSPNKNDGRRA